MSGYAMAKKAVLLPIESQTITIFKKISPLVVNVHNLRKARINGIKKEKEYQVGTASGFLWDDKGYIITNYHVVHGANKVKVTFKKGQSYDVDIVDSSPQRDIAILKLKTLTPILQIKQTLKNFKQIPIANINDLSVGQYAMAIGNPFGFDRTLTTGIISALGRKIPGFSGISIRDMIQTDASINPGNSGGPLLNSHGQVIGMNTLIYSRSGTSSGIGFAVPIKHIKRTIDQVKQYGRIIRAGLGFERLNDQLAKHFKVKGVIINKVLPGSIADKAGLQGITKDKDGKIILGDIITKINDHPILQFDDLYNLLDNMDIGENITVTFSRANKVKTIKLRTMDLSIFLKKSKK